MKKGEVKLVLGGSHVDTKEIVAGWMTDVDGLLCCKWTPPDAKASDARWLLVHGASGKRIHTFHKRAECNEFADYLAGEVDWTEPESDSFMEAATSAYQRALEDLNAARFKEAGGTLAPSTTSA